MTEPGNRYETQEELDAALARSREAANWMLEDPDTRARIFARLAELETQPPRPTMTGDEFLARAGFGPDASSAE